MANKYIKKIALYLFFSIEIFAFVLLLLLVEHFPKFIHNLQTVLNLYTGMVFGIIILEIVYFVCVIKKKMGFIGFPLLMIKSFKCDILENLYSYTAIVTYSLLIVFGIIMLLRIIEIVYLYKHQDSTKGFPVALLITATVSDLTPFITRFFIL